MIQLISERAVALVNTYTHARIHMRARTHTPSQTYTHTHTHAPLFIRTNRALSMHTHTHTHTRMGSSTTADQIRSSGSLNILYVNTFLCSKKRIPLSEHTPHTHTHTCLHTHTHRSYLCYPTSPLLTVIYIWRQ